MDPTPLTFTLSELTATLQLIKDQNMIDIFSAHVDDSPEPIPSPVLEPEACPACVLRAHRRKCYACGTKIHDAVCSIYVTTRIDPEEVAASDSSTLKVSELHANLLEYQSLYRLVIERM
ncbi:hypothetical protein F4604DRAFT_1676327 [Suillus subluteus]|nr:hypothetical protein F4604DRAFT_1676327 [Suillus subluteus]